MRVSILASNCGVGRTISRFRAAIESKKKVRMHKLTLREKKEKDNGSKIRTSPTRASLERGREKEGQRRRRRGEPRAESPQVLC